MSEYSGYGLEQLWQMVDAARQGLQPSHDQVAALDRAQQMLSGHAEALGLAREQLAARWPPETNAAAAVYLGELDRLIAAVQETALTCAVNVFHINTVSDAIVQAHAALAPLHAEFVANTGALAQYDAEIEEFSDSVSFTSGVKTVVKGAALLFTSPPIDDGRQEELTRRAQETMLPLAGAAQDGATYIRPPAPYTPPAVNVDGEDFTEIPQSRQSGDGALLPPVIDSPAQARQSDGSAAAPTDQPGEPTSPATGGSGPSLSGFVPAQAASVSAPQTPVGAGPGAAGPVGGFGVLPIGIGSSGVSAPPAGGFGGRLPGSLTTEAAARGRDPFGGGADEQRGAAGRLPRGLAAEAAAQGRASFGALGGLPSTGTGGFPSALGGRGAAPRVNPPGGVIGAQPGPPRIVATPAADGSALTGRSIGSEAVSGSARGSARPASRNGSLGAQSGGCARRATEPEKLRWDPDNPWKIDEGVDPVIIPEPAPGRIDPGPGVIGLNR